MKPIPVKHRFQMAMIGFMAHANVHTNKPWYSTNAVKKKKVQLRVSPPHFVAAPAPGASMDMFVYSQSTHSIHMVHTLCVCVLSISIYTIY